MSSIEYIEGLIAKAPHERAPKYVKAKLSIKREAMIADLQKREGEWVNAEIKEGQSGKWYVAVDPWKPESGKPSSEPRQPSRAPVPDCPQPDQGGFTDDLDEVPF